MDSIRVVLISIPRDEADSLASQLVEQRFAACVNIVPKIESYFWWDDEVTRDTEALLIVKTTKEKYPKLQEWVQANHPYDLPEVIAFSLAEGLPEYISWVQSEANKG